MPSQRGRKPKLQSWLFALLQNNEIEDVCWLDPPPHKYFQVPWVHKSSKKYSTEKDGLLFIKWAIYKGKIQDISEWKDVKHWKTNFRCAIRNRHLEFGEWNMKIKRSPPPNCRPPSPGSRVFFFKNLLASPNENNNQDSPPRLGKKTHLPKSKETDILIKDMDTPSFSQLLQDLEECSLNLEESSRGSSSGYSSLGEDSGSSVDAPSFESTVSCPSPPLFESPLSMESETLDNFLEQHPQFLSPFSQDVFLSDLQPSLIEEMEPIPNICADDQLIESSYFDPTFRNISMVEMADSDDLELHHDSIITTL